MQMRFAESPRTWFLGSMGLVLMLSLGLIKTSHAQGIGIPGVDNDARVAINRASQRIDSLLLEFNKVRADAQASRTEADAIRRELEILRRDVNTVQANLDLMFRKVDAKIDDGLKPVSESVQRGVDELEILKNAQQDLLAQLEEARKEVRELRGKMEESQAQSGRQRTQIEELRTLSGRQDEQQRALLDEQRKSKDLQRTLDELRAALPVLVKEEGATFYAQSAEKTEFDNAKSVFNRANYQGSRKQFAEFLLRYPRSGYAAAARFWKGNAEFLEGDYRSALITLRPLQMAEPNYPKTPEAMLAIANCYSELKDLQSARKTLEDLVEQYEKSEAASVARDRLSKL